MTPYHVVIHSTHKATSSGHGGNKRLEQLVEFFRARAASTRLVLDSFGGSPRANVEAIARGLLPRRSGPAERYLNLRAVRNYGVARAILDDDAPLDGTVLVFDTMVRAWGAIFPELRERGARTVIFPQNVDSLYDGVVDPISGRVSPAWFEDELDVYRRADLTCCLSREDQWFLSLHGIPARYLPYHPTPDRRRQLAALRDRRGSSAGDVVIVLGSAHNQPTFKGMQALLRRAPELARAAAPREVVVIGHGTEALRAVVRAPEVRVLGGVSDEVLDDYLVRASLCVCCQAATTGALTRIPELACAGVPIVATYTAARSYQHLAGLRVAETTGEVFELVRTWCAPRFAAPDPPIDAETALTRAIERLAAGENTD